jgi:hypothetical protein
MGEYVKEKVGDVVGNVKEKIGSGEQRSAWQACSASWLRMRVPCIQRIPALLG